MQVKRVLYIGGSTTPWDGACAYWLGSYGACSHKSLSVFCLTVFVFGIMYFYLYLYLYLYCICWCLVVLAQVTYCFHLNSQLTLVGLIFSFGLFVGTAIGCLGLLCQFHIIYLRHTSTFQIYFFLLWSTLHICKIISSYAVTIFDLMVKKYALTSMSQNRPF